MLRRRDIALGVVCLLSVWLLSSCGGGAPAAPPPAPSVTLSAPSLTFGGQLVGTTSSGQAITLTNSGNAALSITSISVGGTNPTEFAQTNTCGTSVAAGANCTITVTFTPAATGSRTASVTITDNASGSPQSVSLTGTGTAPTAAVSPATLSFSNQLVGTTSSAMTATLSNSGTAPLTIASITISGTNSADFASQSSSTCSTGSPVAAGGSCNINIAFTPTVNGAESATLTVTDNSGAVAGSTQTVALSGTGTEPVAALSPATLSFSSEVVGTTSSAMTATLSNSGTGPLTIASIVISGTNSADFASQSSSTCSTGSPVAAGGSCNINIAFTPSVNGAESATLTVTDNSGAKTGTTQIVALSGTGTSPTATVSGSVTKGAVSGATVTIYLVNSNGSNGTAVATGTTASDGTFSITLTPAPSGPVRVSVTGGTYPSEWNGNTVTSSSAVTALLDSVGSGISGLSVTAVSTFVDSYAAGSLKSGTATSETSAHAAAESLIRGLYGFPAGTVVETLTPSFSSTAIGTTGFTLGLIIGTLTAEGASLNSTDPDSLIGALALDISDGVWNGLAFGVTIPLGTSGINLPTTAGTSDFSSSLGTYVSSGASPTANGVTSSNASSTVTSIDAGVATCACTPPAVGLAATSSGAINSLAFTPSNDTKSHQYVFIAARTSGVVAVDITNPTATAFPTTVWQQLYQNLPGSGGFGSIAVGGVIPFVGTAGHPQLFALAYGSKHILILNANTLVTGTPWVSNPVDAEMDVPIKATSEVEFSGGAAYIGSGLPLGGSILGLATADGYMIFDASQVPSASAVVDVYPVQDPTEIVAENLGGDPVHHYLLGGNESTCEGFGCPGGVQLVDLSAGVTSGTSYYITPANFPTVFPGTPTSNSVDATSVDPSLQVGILTFEDTGDTELVDMSGITETVSTTAGVLNSWAPPAGGMAHVVFGTSSPPTISGSAVDATTHMAYFMAGYSTDMVVGQIQNPASVPTGSTWQGLSDWSFYSIPSSASLSTYTYATDPHADGVVYNLMEKTPYAYELDGSNLGVVQTDMAGFLAIPRAGTSGDAAHQPGTDPATVTNTATGGKVMQEITWVLPLGITSTSLPTGTVGVAYSATLTAVNGTSPYTWSTNSAGTTTLTSAGLTLNSAGTISGTPTTVGSFTFTLTVTDSSTPAETASVSVTIYIDATPPSITTSSLAAATLGSAYTATVTATGGQTPYTWSITGGALPAGLALTSGTPSATIAGTPTAAGIANFTVSVTDSSPVPQTTSVSLSITVNNTTSMSVPSSITLPAGTQYVGYNGNLQTSITGGTPPFTCSLTAGTLPTWATLDTNNCAIVGVPTATGTTSGITVSVTDSTSPTPTTVSTIVSFTINAATNNAELKGQYAFVMNGYDVSGLAFVLAGSFTADGAGNITAGMLDVNDSGSSPVSLTFTGSYGVGADNRGGMVITDSDSSVHTILFSLGALSSGVSTKAHAELFDSTDGTAAGDMMLQDTTAFSTSALTSTYTLGFVGGYDGRLAAGGVFTANGSGALSSGEADIDNDGTIFPAAPFTGSYSVGSTNGRGTGSFTLTLPTGTATVNFAFYVVSATQLYLVSTDTITTSPLASVFSGEAVGQTGGPYSNSSASGISVFSTVGYGGPPSPEVENPYEPTSDAQAGLITLDGKGGFTLTSDENNGGNVTTNTITGFYNVAANGRVSLTITSGAGTSSYPPVIYLEAPGEGLIIGTDPSVEFGSFVPQAAGPFSNSSFSGNYFFGSGFGEGAVPNSEMRSGVLTADGAGNLSGTYDTAKLQYSGSSITGITLQPGKVLSTTYSVSSNGRVTTTSGNIVFYIVGPTEAVGVDTDPTGPHPSITVVEQ